MVLLPQLLSQSQCPCSRLRLLLPPSLWLSLWLWLSPSLWPPLFLGLAPPSLLLLLLLLLALPQLPAAMVPG